MIHAIALSNISVGRGGAYIYIELIVAALSGYILWLLLSKITTPDVIGVSSTVVSLGYIFATLVSLGIPNAIPRFLGKMLSENKLGKAKLFIKDSFFLISIGITVGTLAILTLRDYSNLDSLGLNLILLSVIFMASSAMASLFRFVTISAFRANLLVLRQILTSGIRVTLSVILVLIGAGSVGLTIGYTIGQVLAAILTGYIVIKILKTSRDNQENFAMNQRQSYRDLKQTCKTILAASVPSWIPTSITTIGAQAGTIIVFGTSGSNQAGIYFIAFSLFSAIGLITTSLLSAAFPALSAMQEGRKRFTWRTIKISLIISLPLSSSLIFYSDEILGLLGNDYIKGSASLDILLLSVLPTAVMTGVNTLVYAYGNYKQVLFIGLAVSVPRTLLYFILVPIYGGAGAAMSYTIGAFAGFIISIFISQKVRFKIYWRELVFLWCISSAIAFVLAYFDIHYIFAIPMIFAFSYLTVSQDAGPQQTRCSGNIGDFAQQNFSSYNKDT